MLSFVRPVTPCHGCDEDYVSPAFTTESGDYGTSADSDSDELPEVDGCPENGLLGDDSDCLLGDDTDDLIED